MQEQKSRKETEKKGKVIIPCLARQQTIIIIFNPIILETGKESNSRLLPSPAIRFRNIL